MTFTLDEAELVGVSLQSVAFGIYLVLFAATLYVYITRTQVYHQPANKLMLGGALFLFVLVSTHWILDQLRLWTAFIGKQGEAGGALKFYGTYSERRDVIRNAILVMEIFTVDSLLLYRLFIIWGGDWRVVVLPAMTLLGTVVCATAYCVGFAQAPAGVNLWQLQVSHWVVAAFSLTLATNVLAVALIAGRIIHHNRTLVLLNRVGSRGLSSVVVITVESAAIYCAVNFIILVSLLANSAVDFTSRDMASPITGISFCLITLRVGLKNCLGWQTMVEGNSSAAPVSAQRRSTAPIHVTIEHAQETFTNVNAKHPSSMLGDPPMTAETNPV